MLLVAGAVAGRATTITYLTPAGSATSGGPVSALATLVTGPGSLFITLTDSLASPTSIAQLVSDLDFVLSNGTTAGSLLSSRGQEIAVAEDGTFTAGGSVDTGWVLNRFGPGLRLTVLGTPEAPGHLLIGPPDGTYSMANASIANNGPHNPFLNQTATFELTIPGVTADVTITSATFSFGTTAGLNIFGTPDPPGDPPKTPEPATVALLGTGLIGLRLLRH